jgi:hypothetical protein
MTPYRRGPVFQGMRCTPGPRSTAQSAHGGVEATSLIFAGRRVGSAPAGEGMSIPFESEDMMWLRQCYLRPYWPVSQRRLASLDYDAGDREVSGEAWAARCDKARQSRSRQQVAHVLRRRQCRAAAVRGTRCCTRFAQRCSSTAYASFRRSQAEMAQAASGLRRGSRHTPSYRSKPRLIQLNRGSLDSSGGQVLIDAAHRKALRPQ